MERFRDLVKIVSTLQEDQFLVQFPHPLLFYSNQPGVLESFVHTRLIDTQGGPRSIDRFSEQVLDFFPLWPNPRPSETFPHKIFIGRDERRDFVVQHSTVSKRHACLFLDAENAAWKLVDSGSTNGTLVRGHALKPGEPVGLNDGDVITFGKVHFLFFSPVGGYRYMRLYQKFRDAMEQAP